MFSENGAHTSPRPNYILRNTKIQCSQDAVCQSKRGKEDMAVATKRKDAKTHIYFKRMWLVTLRYDKGLSQEKMADILNMTTSTYNQIEAGRQGQLMNCKKLMAIAEVFDKTVDEICVLESGYLDKCAKANGKETR